MRGVRVAFSEEWLEEHGIWNGWAECEVPKTVEVSTCHLFKPRGLEYSRAQRAAGSRRLVEKGMAKH